MMLHLFSIDFFPHLMNDKLQGLEAGSLDLKPKVIKASSGSCQTHLSGVNSKDTSTTPTPVHLRRMSTPR